MDSVGTEKHGWGKPSKPDRLSFDDAKERVLSTALKMLTETGLTVSLEHLSLEELIRAAGVPRSSVYRIWGTKEALYTELLVRLANPADSIGAAFDPETLRVAQEVFEKYLPLATSREDKLAIMREAIRRAAKRNFDTISTSSPWRTYVAILATVPTIPEGADRDQVLNALRTSERRFIATMAHFYEEMVSTLGFAFKPGITAEITAGIGAAVVEGLAQRQLVNPEVFEVKITHPGIDGENVEWHLASIGFLAVIEALVDTTAT